MNEDSIIGLSTSECSVRAGTPRGHAVESMATAKLRTPAAPASHSLGTDTALRSHSSLALLAL